MRGEGAQDIRVNIIHYFVGVCTEPEMLDALHTKVGSALNNEKYDG